MTQHIDVTDRIEIGDYDDELATVTKCVCGAAFKLWGDFYISIYPDTPYACPKCGRKFFFGNEWKIFEVVE